MKFKRTLTGLALGALLLGNLSRLHSETLNFPELPKKPDVSEIQMTNFGMMLEDAHLFYFDEYVQTKYSFENFPGMFSEDNSFWKPFFKKNLWGLAYAIPIGGLILGNYISNKIDKSGYLAGVIDIAAGIADYIVVLSNYDLIKKSLGNSLPSREKNIPFLYLDLKF